MVRRAATTAVALLLLGASVEAAAGQLAGMCFDLAGSSAWRPVPGALMPSRPPDLSGDSVNLTPPTRFQLAEEPAPFGGGLWRMVVIPDDALQTLHSWRQWRQENDSLLLLFTTGFTGIEAHFQIAREGWPGTLRTLSDNHGTQLYERDARLTPVDCAEPPPVPASADPPLPRTVELASGVILELGRPLPAGVASQPRRTGAITLLVETAGPFAGADTVVALIGPGGALGRLELRFPAGHDLDPLAALLEAEAGRPNLDNPYRTEWRNRTTQLLLYRAAQPGQRARFLMIDPRHRGEQ